MSTKLTTLVLLIISSFAPVFASMDPLSKVEGEIVLNLDPSKFTSKEHKIYDELLDPSKGNQTQTVVLILDGKIGSQSLIAQDLQSADASAPILFYMPLLTSLIHKYAENASKAFYSNESILQIAKQVKSVNGITHKESRELKTCSYAPENSQVLYERRGDKGEIKGAFRSESASGRFYMTLTKAGNTVANHK